MQNISSSDNELLKVHLQTNIDPNVNVIHSGYFRMYLGPKHIFNTFFAQTTLQARCYYYQGKVCVSF